MGGILWYDSPHQITKACILVILVKRKCIGYVTQGVVVSVLLENGVYNSVMERKYNRLAFNSKLLSYKVLY